MNSDPLTQLRTVEFSLTKEALREYIAGAMYSMGVLKNDEDIKVLNLPDSIPVEVKFMKEREVKTIKNYG